MKTLTNINIPFLIVYIIIIAHNAHSFSLQDRKSTDQIAMEPYLIDDTFSSIDDESESIENQFPTPIHPLSNKRRSNSAEKYFDWASKTNRPMEYLRGKRFWLFTKKDEHVNNHETIPSARASPSSLSQGIWRSGIVGRRRR